MADKKSEVQFAVEAFEIRQFSSIAPKKSGVRKDRLEFQIQHLFEVNQEKMFIDVCFRIKVMPAKKSSEELAFIETRTVFRLKGIEKKKLKELPEHLIATFLSIAYSSTRGALAAKAQGTIAGDTPLPLINPAEIIRSRTEHSRKQ